MLESTDAKSRGYLSENGHAAKGAEYVISTFSLLGQLSGGREVRKDGKFSIFVAERRLTEESYGAYKILAKASLQIVM